MSTELIINASLPETRIAMMESGEIQELLIERASGKGIVGNIYKGRVTRVLPGMQAAFVDIGLEKAAFLYVDDVHVHSEIWEEEEGAPAANAMSDVTGEHSHEHPAGEEAHAPAAPTSSDAPAGEAESGEGLAASAEDSSEEEHVLVTEEDTVRISSAFEDEEEDEDEEDDRTEEMGPDDNGGEGGNDQPQGTMAPPSDAAPAGAGEGSGGGEGQQAQGGQGQGGERGGRRRHRRGRRGGRFRNRRGEGGEGQQQTQSRQQQQEGQTGDYPENFQQQVADQGQVESDRSSVAGEGQPAEGGADLGRPETRMEGGEQTQRGPNVNRSDFNAQRSRDRRIRSKTQSKPRAQVNIQDLLKEGQEVIVQVAKDPIATKGARLTCHISLPGRHLVCMPTIDHVGVSRRIEREDERRKLREYVERYRPRNLGFIVRTASGKSQSEKRIKQDIEYLTRLWNEIREKAGTVTAPALVYEDLNSVLRAIRDWVTEDIDKVIVDSRYHYNEILRFVSHFMPSLKQKVELYHGDIPIFDAYGISTELSRALERKVWLKSGGYIVVDQAEALVAIDVNTGRYVGKKNLEDTILKTNLEAVQEIAYQLRLRNCGGIIILDLIDMEREENKQRVYRALEEALKKDRARPSILKISELGLIEMTRKRTRDTMVRALCDSCSHCEGKGFVKSKLTVAYEVLREVEREGIEKDIGKILVQAHPDAIDILAIDERETLDQLERRYRKQIYLQAVTDFHPEQFEVIGDKREGAERGREQQNERGRDRQESRGDRSRGGKGRGDRDRGRGRQHQEQHNQQNAGRRDRQQQQRNPIKPRPVEVEGGVPQENGAAISDEDSQAKFLSQGGQQGPHAAIEGQPPRQDFHDEEDRLAFLRAQAAQDAALARLGGAQAPQQGGGGRQQQPRRDDNNNGGSGEGGAGRRGRRGRRGGRNRRGPGGQNLSGGTGPKPLTGGGEGTPSGSSSGNTSGGGGGETGGGGSSGGPSDHSQPPA